jgi:hypothetical protein
MGLLDTLLGRTRPVQPNLDSLFSLPSAAITLQSAAGLTVSGRAGVCYKPPTGQGFADMQAEVVTLLDMEGGGELRTDRDAFGYQWVLLSNPDLETLVSQVHLVNSSLTDAGWGPQLLCSVFGLAPVPDDGPSSGAGFPVPGPGRVLASTAFLVYLYKRGSFYPFVPDGPQHRDTAGELKLRSVVAGDLVVEPELDRWFPLWESPVG